MKRLLRAICLVLLLTATFAVPASAEPSAAHCDDCHRDSVDKGSGKRYVHLPFLRGQCTECHLAGQAVAPTSEKEVGEAEEGLPEKIRWFREAYGVAEAHWVLLPQGRAGDSVIYKTWDGSHRSSPQRIFLPPLGDLQAKADDGRAPAITAVEVTGVRRGISTTATIAWTTDEFSDSKIAYGVGGLDSSRQDGKLVRDHEVILQGLDRDRTYRFKVISTDLFGNSSQSELISFSTDKTFILPEARHEQAGAVGEARVSGELFRHEGRYLAVFTADRPVSLSLGVPAEKEAAEVAKQPLTAPEAGSSHPVLKSERETNIDACKSCHGYLKEYLSHPVNVWPKAGMVIPPEYPLLPDGRVSCMSCHVEHGANYEYRLVKSGKKELCLGCHSDY